MHRSGREKNYKKGKADKTGSKKMQLHRRRRRRGRRSSFTQTEQNLLGLQLCSSGCPALSVELASTPSGWLAKNSTTLLWKKGCGGNFITLCCLIGQLESGEQDEYVCAWVREHTPAACFQETDMSVFLTLWTQMANSAQINLPLAFGLSTWRDMMGTLEEAAVVEKSGAVSLFRIWRLLTSCYFLWPLSLSRISAFSFNC